MSSHVSVGFRLRYRVIPTVVLTALMYLNVAAIFELSGIRLALPRPWYVARTFWMFSLYSHYTTENYSFEAWGRLADSPLLDPEWIPIDLRRYFPQNRGEANRRMNLHSYRGDERRSEGYSRMAQLLKANWRRDHPDQPIDRVLIYSLVWPKSVHGYEYLRSQATKRLIIDE